ETTDILYERWFYCEDLGTQLVPIIKQFQASEECKTGKPSKNSKLRTAPYSDDITRQMVRPFHLKEWLKNNAKEIDENGFKALFDNSFQSKITVFGGNKTHEMKSPFETFVLQVVINSIDCVKSVQKRALSVPLIHTTKNDSNVIINNKCIQLVAGNTILVPKDMRSIPYSRRQLFIEVSSWKLYTGRYNAFNAIQFTVIQLKIS
ncbi:unnamed protein product, partial [Medioppia subpectinata]